MPDESPESLRKKAEQLQVIFETSEAGIVLISPRGIIEFANRRMTEMFGRSAQELVGLPYSILVHESERVEGERCMDRLLTGEVHCGGWDRRYVRADGTDFWGHLSGKRVENEDGGARNLTLVITDITERKQAEMERVKNERRMTSLFDISQYPFTNQQDFLDHALHEVIALTESRIEYIYFYCALKREFTLNSWSNGVMKECAVTEQQTKYSLDSTGVWGEAVRQKRPILLNDFQAHHLLKKGVPEGHVLLRRFLTVPITIDAEIVAVVGVANKESDYDESDVMQLTLFMDSVWVIAARKRAEDENRMLESKLAQAQKMESLGVLAGGIAHDFNNILAIIIGHCALADMDRDKAFVDHLPEIERAANRGAELCGQMLSYAGKTKLVQTRIDLPLLVGEMAKMLRMTIGRNVAIEFDGRPDIPFIVGDASQIRQIVMNLIINASEAIGDGQGSVALSLAKFEVEGERPLKDCRGSFIAPGRYVVLEVVDTGCGMDEEIKLKIFEPFFTTKFTGRGLGMSAVLGISSAHRGALQLFSEPGEGSTFKVFLPWRESDAERRDAPSPVRKTPWRGKGTVLLVEDEDQVRVIARRLLENFGFSVVEAANGKEAMRLYRENAAKIDLVITDMGMPVMDGYELFGELKYIDPELPIVLSSGFGDAVVESRMAGHDVAGLLSKPYGPDQLRDTLSKVLDGATGAGMEGNDCEQETKPCETSASAGILSCKPGSTRSGSFWIT